MSSNPSFNGTAYGSPLTLRWAPKKMAKVVLIGTSHKYQTRNRNNEVEHANQFEKTLLSLCSEHQCMGIAEEMNHTALAEYGTSESLAQAVCSSLGLAHQLSDPPPEIREQLGIICDETLFRSERWIQNWEQERIDAAVRQSHEIREKHWLAQLQVLRTSPLLFVCGANHVESFSTLLGANGFDVVVASADWEPNPSFNGTPGGAR